MNTSELFQRTNMLELHKQTKYSVVSGECIWGLGGLLHAGLFCEVHIQGIQSISQVALNF